MSSCCDSVSYTHLDVYKRQVKASGGVRNYADMMAVIEAGATRIGTSAGVQLMNNEESKADY